MTDKSFFFIFIYKKKDFRESLNFLELCGQQFQYRNFILFLFFLFLIVDILQ